MENKFKFLLISLVSLSLSVSSQNKSAEQILNELTTTTNSYTNIKASFAYKMENEEAGINETTNGTLLVSGEKYHLNIAGQEVISDGTTLWTYLVDSDEVQVNEVSEETGFSPNKLLSNYNNEYEAKLEKELSKNGESCYQLKLKPKDKKSSFDYVILLVNQKKMQLSEFIIHDFDGNVFTYDIKQFIANSDIPEDSFVFDASKYPGVEVIDMR